MRLYFIRHGESTANAGDIVTGQVIDPGLTTTGMEQARKAAGWIKENNLTFDVIVASPSLRAMETARIIARHLHYPVVDIVQLPDLIERGCGDYEGGSTDAYLQAPESVAVKEHGVESLDALYERATKIMAEIQAKYSNKNVLLVSHNGIGKMLRIVTDGRDGEEFDRTISLPNANVSKLL